MTAAPVADWVGAMDDLVTTVRPTLHHNIDTK